MRPLFTYTGICEDMSSRLNLKQSKNCVYIECFNPLEKNEIILREEVLPENYDNLYSWNYTTKKLRKFGKEMKPFGLSVIPLSSYLVVLNQGQHPSFLRNRPAIITYFSVFYARNYRKVLTMKNEGQRALPHRKNYSSYEYNPYYYCYSCSEDQGKICLKYKNQAFF